jgi:hypothetical protein
VTWQYSAFGRRICVPPGFMAHRCEHLGGVRASRATTFLVKDCIHCVLVKLCAPLQATATRIALPSLSLTLCNAYLPPKVPVPQADLTNKISKIPPPLIFFGDFNAKNLPWGVVLTDERGRLVSGICTGFDLIQVDKSTSVLRQGPRRPWDLPYATRG